ncbi:MAG: hypothetical protein HAW63_00565 [Bdellovibrionaceae bacterium]|nr:hypothetical protein [Pseudobdellovibrionaceae bacterium]
MKSLVFFVPIRESFAFLSVRQNVIRIPEVLIQLKEAERIINESYKEFEGSVDLISIMQSDWPPVGKPSVNSHLTHKGVENTSAKVTALRKKLSIIVSYVSQVGLFNRYLKTYSYPEFLMGNSISSKALSVVLKRCSMQKMIKSILEEDSVIEDALPTNYYIIFKRIAGKYVEQERIDSATFKFGFEQIALKENFKEFIYLGPGQSLPVKFSNLSANQFTELESISMDPMLNWFWTDVREPVFSTPASIVI